MASSASPQDLELQLGCVFAADGLAIHELRWPEGPDERC